MNHVVIKQVLELHLSAKTDAFRVQQAMSGCFQRDLMPVLERVFDAFGTDDVIRIDRLEVSIGSVNMDAADWPTQVAQALNDALTDLLTQTLSTPNAPGFSRVSQPQSRFADWLFFLQTGRLRWSRSEKITDWQPDLLETLATQYQAVEQFRRLVQSNPVALDRLVLQHPPAFLKTLIETCNGHGQTELWAGWQELELLFDQFGDQLFGNAVASAPASKADRLRAFTVRFWRWVLRTTLRHERPPQAKPLLTDFWQAEFRRLDSGSLAERARQLNDVSIYIRKQARHYPVLLQVVPTVIERSDLLPSATPTRSDSAVEPATGMSENRTQSQVVPTVPEQSDPLSSAAPTRSDRALERSDALPSAAPRRSDRVAEPPAKQLGNQAKKQPIADPPNSRPATDVSGVSYVNNAGIVLLNPFFAPLFRKLGWLDGSEFQDKRTQQKAMVLLHFLATGDTQPAEHELVLPKLLCAWPAEEPVDVYVGLVPEETAEADAMMASAIEHWGALGNVSPAALREGFLQREGRLIHEQEKWRLQIEANTLDILLDQLPFGWSIGLIRLPWMNHLLTIDWR